MKKPVVAMSQASIHLQGVSKWFFKKGTPIPAIVDVTLDVPAGSFVSLVGPSGCGKSTVLNCIAGLQIPDEGAIVHGGRRITGLNIGVGYMTQKDTLLPWRSVRDNVTLPLQIHRMAPVERQREAQRLIDLVGLSGFEHHLPAELSGGMLKRAALARALVRRPTTLLMDEPFGNLDAQLKLQLQRELLAIWGREQQTVVFVTHDLEEAISLSDRIVVLTGRPGRIKEIIDVTLPRPRDPVTVRFEPSFQPLHRRLWGLIEATLALEATGGRA